MTSPRFYRCLLFCLGLTLPDSVTVVTGYSYKSGAVFDVGTGYSDDSLYSSKSAAVDLHDSYEQSRSMLRNSGCQEVANKVVVVAAQHGTGAAALTLLLQKLGVFMISGSRECAIHGGDPNQPKYRFPRGACVRLRSEHDSACQNRRMDFQVLKTESSLNCLKKMIHRTKDVCNKASTLSYPYSNVLYETVLREVKASLGHCVLRLKDCSYKKALSECPIALGWKSNLNLALLPVLAQLQAESKLSVTVLHLVRDGHDMVLGDMRDDLRNLYEVAESGALSAEELEHVDFDTKMRFWSKLNTK
eukprot:gene14750-17428_t